MFSNRFFRTQWSGATREAPYVGNEVFCAALSKWVFAETGVLRFRDIIHNKVKYSVYPTLVFDDHRCLKYLNLLDVF
jgi:hypothetical protein